MPRQARGSLGGARPVHLLHRGAPACSYAVVVPGETRTLPASDRVASGLPGAIGRFAVRGQLGEGGMGVVLDGYDADLGRRVAIKVVRGDEHPAFRARLLREAAAMAQIEHPNVVRVYEVGNDGGRLFIAMELVDGVTLRGWLTKPRTTAEIAAMFAQVGAGLAAVHRGGLVHRDFKPDNVLVDRAGRARVVDFGLARFDGADRSEVSPVLGATLTQTGALLGTPAYMAPEQLVGASVDARADQYSYCVALREALGRDPPETLRAIVARGLAYDPAARFASMDELLAALATATPMAPSRSSRSGRRIALVMAAVVAIAGGVVGGARVLTRGGAAAGAIDAAVVSPLPTPTPTPIAIVHVDAVTADSPPIVAPVAVDASSAVDSGPHHLAHTIAAVAPDASVAAVAAPAAPAPAPLARDGNPAHRDAVRAAIAHLGYTAADGGGDRRALYAKINEAGADRALRGQLWFQTGVLERRAGSCENAVARFYAALDDLGHATDATAASPWIARAQLGVGLCLLYAGRVHAAVDPLDTASRTFTSGDERAQAQLALGIGLWESGDEARGKDLATSAAHAGSAEVRAAFDTWARAVGAMP